MNGDDKKSPAGGDAKPSDMTLTEEERLLLEQYSRIFIGSYSHTLDSKGRMVVPQAFREQLGTPFCIAPAQDFRSISLYSNLAWARMRSRYARLAQLKPSVMRFQEQFDALSFRGQECDAQGRILLPAKIRQLILGDEKDVEITGANDHVRVVAAKAGEQQFADFMRDLPDILETIGQLDETETERGL